MHIEDISRAFLRRARGAARGRPQPGLQRRPRRGQLPDPRRRARWSSRPCPAARSRFADRRRHGHRSYRVSFAKHPRGAPRLQAAVDGQATGVGSLSRPTPAHHLTNEEFESSRFIRIRASASCSGSRASSTRTCAGGRARVGSIEQDQARDTPIERRCPVVILAGGMGTRLREETERVPKPLVEIGEQADPVAHHEALRPLRLPALRPLPGLQELADQGVLPPLPRAGLRTSPSQHRRRSRADLPRPATATRTGSVTLAETGLDDRHRRPRCWRVQRLHRHGHLHVHLRRRPRARSTSRALLDFHYEPRPHRHRHRRAPDLALRRDARSRDGRAVRVQREADDADGFVSGGFFVFQREFFDYLNDDPDLFFEHAPLRGPAPATASSRCSRTRASGWAWTPTASSRS